MSLNVNNLNIGTISVQGLYLGNDKIYKVYLGDNLVYSQVPLATKWTVDNYSNNIISDSSTVNYSQGENGQLTTAYGANYKFILEITSVNNAYNAPQTFTITDQTGYQFETGIRDVGYVSPVYTNSGYADFKYQFRYDGNYTISINLGSNPSWTSS